MLGGCSLQTKTLVGGERLDYSLHWLVRVSSLYSMVGPWSGAPSLRAFLDWELGFTGEERPKHHIGGGELGLRLERQALLLQALGRPFLAGVSRSKGE